VEENIRFSYAFEKRPQEYDKDIVGMIDVYKRYRSHSRLNVGRVLDFIKGQIRLESDPFKKQAWAEVGIVINGEFLKME